MGSELLTQWLIWAFVVYIAMQCLVTLSTALRERLQGLLSEHVQRQRTETLKQKRIEALREKIRQKKLAEEGKTDSSQKAA